MRKSSLDRPMVGLILHGSMFTLENFLGSCSWIIQRVRVSIPVPEIRPINLVFYRVFKNNESEILEITEF